MNGVDLPGVGSAIAGAIVVAIAVVFFRRGGADRWTSSWGYKAFVARRYLLVPQPKVTQATKRMIAIGLAARVACELAVALGIHASNWHAPMWGLERALELFLVVVIVGGVVVYSRPSFYAFFLGAALLLAGLSLDFAKRYDLIYAQTIDSPGVPRWFVVAVLILTVSGGVLAGLAILFGCLRAYFTFFTTVPIGGVWIGTAALVCVLAVMSGFESDLREKILGSNAHIQVTREDGEFTEWREVKSRIERVPGVVASTPYAVSEVVIAANSNGMNVIIKGIDPQSVGAVTDLVNDLEDKDAMHNLEPSHDGDRDLRVPQNAAQPVGPSVPRPSSLVRDSHGSSGASKGRQGLQAGVDPPPADLPKSGEPIDYSVPAGEPRDADVPPPEPRDAAAPTPEPRDAAVAATVPPGPHDVPTTARPTVDPPPSDEITTDEPPVDYGKPTRAITADPTIEVFDVSDQPSARTRALPGILVGRELAKQTHLYTGEEVHVVSPLSDASNPDATGMPIPFNRDYRVAGIFFTGMFEYDLKYVYVTLDSLQDFLDRGDVVDGIEIRVAAPDNSGAYVERLATLLGPSYRVQDWKDLNRSLFSALKLEKVAMFIVLGIVILVASFSIVGNLIMVVVEKGREIALLKTLGASDPGVMQLFAIQGLLIGLIGTVLGVATGLAACYVGKRVGIPLNPDVYYIDKMPVHVDPSSVFITFVAGVSISIAATFYPAILAARVRPAAGLRH